MKLPSQRQLKVGETIRHVIADMFLREKIYCKSISPELVTISEVRMSGDLKEAKVYFSTLNENENTQEIENELNALTPIIRRELAHGIRIKFLPKLRFVYDNMLDNIERIDKLIERSQYKPSDIEDGAE